MTEEEKKLVEKETAEQILKDLDFTVPDKIGMIHSGTLIRFIKDQKKKFGLLEEYQTLRDYINEKSIGAYHRFEFMIDFIHFEVSDVHEFERYHNKELLDEYVVIKDIKEDNGGNCANYLCIHKLALRKKEDR